MTAAAAAAAVDVELDDAWLEVLLDEPPTAPAPPAELLAPALVTDAPLLAVLLSVALLSVALRARAVVLAPDAPLPTAGAAVLDVLAVAATAVRL